MTSKVFKPGDKLEALCDWHGLNKGEIYTCRVSKSEDDIIKVEGDIEGYFSSRFVLSGVKTSAERKAEPIYSGVLMYFPDAIAAVSRVSKKGNDKHNPGQPLHWARDKSNDHLDCVARHIITPQEIDPDSGEYHLAHAAWRVLAELQLLMEKGK